MQRAGDYRLLPSSPCIDKGINQDWMLDATDLAGNPRILNGTVDMGAYEFSLDGEFQSLAPRSLRYQYSSDDDGAECRRPYPADFSVCR